MSEYLQKIVYLSQEDYNTLAGGGTAHGETGLHEDWIYLTENGIGNTDLSEVISIANGGTGLSSTTAHYAFIGPTSGTGAPSWRLLQIADLPDLDWSKITMGKPTTLSGYGITDAASSTHNHNGTYIKTISSTENAIVRFNDNNGEVKDSIVTIEDNGNISINAAAGGAPSLTLQRGTASDAYTDWRIIDEGGLLKFQSRSGTATWENRASFADNSGNFTANSFIGNGSSLTSLNGSNISSGTIALARLPMGAANTALTGTSTSTAPQYTSINTTLTNTNATGDNTQKLQVTVLGVDSSQVSLGKASTSVYGVTKLSAAADNSNLAATAKSVYDLGETINGLLAAADAMIFKGTLGTGGTVTTLPTNNYQAGWTYKVITENDYGNSSLHLNCEVGDLIIAIKDGPTSGSSVIPADWTIVQTNLEGAVTTLDGATGYLAKFNGNTSITKGPQIGTGTTKFLREDGTWQTPAYTTNTDEKLKIVAVTSGTTYYPIVAANSTAAANRQYDATGFSYLGTNGTTSTVGVAKIILGNSTASGTANNKQGSIGLYGSTAYLTTIISGAPTAANTLTLPITTGTIALTSDIPGTVSKTAAGLCPQLPDETTTTKFLRQDGTWVAPPNDDTHYTTKLIAGGSSATAHAAVSSGNVYLRLFDDSTPRNDIQLAAGSNMTITSNANGVITFDSSYTNTDTLMNYTLGATARAYLMGSQNAPTSTTTARASHGDMGVYLSSTAGQLSAKSLSLNDGTASASSVEKIWMQWNSTDQSLDFIFA